jgi:hypothetical protein
MIDILKRLVSITRTYGPRKPRFLSKERWKSRLKNHRKSASRKSEGSYSDTSEGNERSSHEGRKYSASGAGGNDYPGVPPKVVEDLAIFGLTPPSSLDEVRKARNREIKKYHSDMFLHDPEKLDTSKQIMQIYNTAFDRLKEYYKNR